MPSKLQPTQNPLPSTTFPAKTRLDPLILGLDKYERAIAEKIGLTSDDNFSSYTSEWQNGFNSAIRGYIYNITSFHSYANIRKYFETEREKIHGDARFRKAISNLPTGTLPYQLNHLAASGFDTKFLGKIDGLLQTMSLLQIAFGRYSYEQKISIKTKRKSPQLRASLASYQYRKNKRKIIMGDPTLVDPSVITLSILDAINENVWPRLWHADGRVLYESSALLMPGLTRLDALSKDLSDRNETYQEAKQRYTKEARLYWPGANSGNEQDIIALDAIKQNHLLLNFLSGSASLVHSLHNYTYSGENLENLLAMNLPSDIYQQSEIDYPWDITLNYWRELDAEIKARDKQLPKAPEITKARRKVGEEKYLAAVEAYKKAREANLQDLTDDEIALMESRIREEKVRRAAKKDAMLVAQELTSQSSADEREIKKAIRKLRLAALQMTRAEEIELFRQKIEQKKKEDAERKALRKQKRLAAKEITKAPKKSNQITKSKKPKKRRQLSPADHISREMLRQVQALERKERGRPTRPNQGARKTDSEEPSI